MGQRARALPAVRWLESVIGGAYPRILDLAGPPRGQRLVERGRPVEHTLRRASTRTRFVAAPLSRCVRAGASNRDAGRRRTCMDPVTWPTSRAVKGWLKEGRS